MAPYVDRPKRRWAPKRERLRLGSERPPTPHELHDALLAVDGAGLAEAIERRLQRRRDARERLSVRGFLVALLVNASKNDHKGYVTRIVCMLNTFGRDLLNELGMPRWQPGGGYDRTWRLSHRIVDALDEG